MSRMTAGCNEGQQASCIALENEYATQRQTTALIVGGLETGLSAYAQYRESRQISNSIWGVSNSVNSLNYNLNYNRRWGY
jgi:hypothetical protein